MVKSDPSAGRHICMATPPAGACCVRTPTAPLAVALTISVEPDRTASKPCVSTSIRLAASSSLPLELPPPEELFRVPDHPIHLDIGCARGRCLLGLAERDPHWNHLGVEIRRPLVTVRRSRRTRLGARQCSDPVLQRQHQLGRLDEGPGARPACSGSRSSFPILGSNGGTASAGSCNRHCCSPSQRPCSPIVNCFCRAMFST